MTSGDNVALFQGVIRTAVRYRLMASLRKVTRIYNLLHLKFAAIIPTRLQASRERPNRRGISAASFASH